VAKRAYFKFKKENFFTPDKILTTGWDKLVEVLDRDHYVRYDFSTTTKLLDICRTLKEKYRTLNILRYLSKDRKDLEKKLLEFKGIGPSTSFKTYAFVPSFRAKGEKSSTIVRFTRFLSRPANGGASSKRH